MSESVVYMRGNFPFPFERLISVDLVEDAKQVLSIDIDLLKAIAVELEKFPGFLDRSALKAVVSHYVSDDPQADGVARLISGVDSRLRASRMAVAELLAALREWQQSPDNRNSPMMLTIGELDGLMERLPIIINPYPGLKRQSKAKHLAGALGHPLESIEIICDIRPVFDEERSVVEGAIPLTTLKLVCNGVDGLPISLEAVLSEQAVASLAKKATAATQKLKRLREMLEAKSLPIPALDMTKREE
jgi:hypothetical protein